MNITQNFITPNNWSRPQTKLKGIKGVVIHWVANPGSSAEANRNFFDRRKSGTSGFGSAQFIVKGKTIIQTMNTSEMAYHVGSTVYTSSALRNLSSYPNNCTIGIEMCHNDWTGKPDAETYKTTIELAAKLLKDNGLNESHLWTHHQVVGWKDCHRWYTNNPSEWVKMVQDVGTLVKGKIPPAITTPVKSDPQKDVVYVDILSSGDKGAQVKEWQNKLIKAGYKLHKYGADGDFGNETLEATKQFQKDAKIAVDGAVGKDTRAAMEKKLAAKNSSSSSTTTNIKVGSTVTLQSHASKYQTGQSIPASVKNKKYTVMQIKNVSQSKSKKAYLLKEIMSWVLEQDVQPKGSTSKPAVKKAVKEYVSLPSSAATWKTYKLNVKPVSKNSDWSLAPKSFGGLTYEIIGKPYADVVTINTSKGKRNIYVAKSTGAKLYKL
jgi:N-acetylmuramoyl-L-alanine amidase CwlA